MHLIPDALTVDSDVILFGPLLCFALALGLAWEIIMAVAITRQDVSVGDLRREAGRTRDAKAARRMLAIACVMEEQSREDAAETCGMDRQTLRDWVHRYNAVGLAGLGDRHGGDAQPRLLPEQEAEVAGWICIGPNVEVDGMVRWRCVDLPVRIARGFGIARTSAAWASRAKPLLCPGCTVSVSPGCPRARAIPRRTLRCRHLSGRVHRPCDRRDEARVGQLAETA